MKLILLLTLAVPLVCYGEDAREVDTLPLDSVTLTGDDIIGEDIDRIQPYIGVDEQENLLKGQFPPVKNINKERFGRAHLTKSQHGRFSQMRKGVKNDPPMAETTRRTRLVSVSARKMQKARQKARRIASISMPLDHTAPTTVQHDEVTGTAIGAIQKRFGQAREIRPTNVEDETKGNVKCRVYHTRSFLTINGRRNRCNVKITSCGSAPKRDYSNCSIHEPMPLATTRRVRHILELATKEMNAREFNQLFFHYKPLPKFAVTRQGPGMDTFRFSQVQMKETLCRKDNRPVKLKDCWFRDDGNVKICDFTVKAAPWPRKEFAVMDLECQ